MTYQHPFDFTKRCSIMLSFFPVNGQSVLFDQRFNSYDDNLKWLTYIDCIRLTKIKSCYSALAKYWFFLYFIIFIWVWLAIMKYIDIVNFWVSSKIYMYFQTIFIFLFHKQTNGCSWKNGYLLKLIFQEFLLKSDYL